jgi:hypothetical protein
MITGIGVHDPLEIMFMIHWNRCSRSNGIGVHDPPEYAPLLTNWPASVLGASGGGRPDTALPSDSSVPYWTVLLPAMPGVILHPSDLMTDDLGRAAVVAGAELTDLGWRLTVKQAIT